MSRFQLSLVVVLAAGLITLACSQTQAPPQNQTAVQSQEPAKPPTPEEQKMQSAMSAGPPGIAADATIMDWSATPDGPMTELRKGTNGWTCLPDMASTPGRDPMCMDQVSMQWAAAWMTKKPPQLSGVGIAYMLQGGSTADNDDPFATEPKAGNSWLNEPPHLMVFGAKIDPAVYSNEPNTTRPWVMWKGTPYEHLMVPVK